MKLINTFTWFRAQPHQEEAITWLNQQLPQAVKSQFYQRFLQSPSPQTADSHPWIQLELYPTQEYRGRFRVFALCLTNNGQVVDRIDCLSGATNTQQEAFIHPKDDYSGSHRCLPEGVYSLGKVEDSVLMHQTRSWEEGIGRYWIAITVLPQYAVNNRGSFGIHADANARYSPGSAGCICPFAPNGMDRILNWMNASARPVQLVCDLGIGFLRQQGYQSPAERQPREKEQV